MSVTHTPVTHTPVTRTPVTRSVAGHPAAPAADGRRARAVAVTGLAGYGVGAAVATLVVHQTSGQIGLTCPFRALTGLFCPFCGGTRAVAALTNGDLPAALSYNAVAVPLVMALALYWVSQVVVALRGGVPRMPRLSSRTLAVLGALLLVFAVWRNIPALPLADVLAP